MIDQGRVTAEYMVENRSLASGLFAGDVSALFDNNMLDHFRRGS